MLRAGGNAVDAVCAASFAAFVAESPLCSPAGAGALVVGTPDQGLRALDFFAAVPGLGLRAEPTLDFFDVTVDFGPTQQVFHIGRAAAAVPGALPGLLAAHDRYGELPLKEVVAPAVALAEDGYRISDGLAHIVSILEPIARQSTEVARILGVHGSPPAGGAQLRNPELGAFLRQLAVAPHQTLRGPFADAMVEQCGPEVGGLLTRRDLQTYRPVWREPLWTEVGDLRMASNPPPSSGGGLIAIGMQLACRLKLHQPTWASAEHALEVAALLTALSDVRSDGYDDKIAEPADALRVLANARQGGYTRMHDRRREERHLGSTTHISVRDERGGVASLTMSNGEGCGRALPGLGVHVNNFLGEEDINPRGFHQTPAGRRMTTMMAPTVVCQGAAPVLALGSGGSNRIRSAILQVLLARIFGGMDLDQAVQSPRLHVEGSTLWYEAPGFSDAALEALASGWPDATRFDAPSMFFGGVHAVSPDAAAGDPRRGGATVTV